MPRIVFDPPKTYSHQPNLWIGLRLLWVALSESVAFLMDALLHGVDRDMADRHVRNFWQRLLRVSHTQLRVIGLQNIDAHQSYVYMSNHESVMDIPAILGAVPQSVRMVAKEGLFKVPFFGAAMRGAGFIPVDRCNLQKAKGQLEMAKAKLQDGLSLWVAPEGTRSRSLELLPFKKGGFHVALALGVRIVPVWIEGAAEVLPSDSLWVRPGRTILVSLGKPIDTSRLTQNNLPQLMEQVRTAILTLGS